MAMPETLQLETREKSKKGTDKSIPARQDVDLSFIKAIVNETSIQAQTGIYSNKYRWSKLEIF